MVNLLAGFITTFSKITLMVFFAIYTFDCFLALVKTTSYTKQRVLYHTQNTLMYLIIINANLLIFFKTLDIKILLFALVEILYFALTLFIYDAIYDGSSKSLLNNMCMLLAISFIMLTRLSIESAVKQFVFACIATLFTCFIPSLMVKVKGLKNLTYIYAIVGIAGLLFVLIFAGYEYGAKLSINIGGFFSIQPSEFIKVLFVFFIAGMMQYKVDFKTFIYTSLISAVFVLILVASRDLGGAFIYLTTYLTMTYVATRKPMLLFGGVGAGAFAFYIAYHMFSHVRTRVVAWQDPLAYAKDQGYQISQSLFAIGGGGWLGSGLMQGMPGKIPVVTKDFVFSAIAEELGCFFALCLILVYMSCFLMMFNIALRISDMFYKLIALGLGTVFVIQAFLNLGGVIRFIPSTGVTLPLISYGGSSLFSMIILFAIIQGLYVLQNNGDINYKTQSRRRRNAKYSNREFAVITYIFVILYLLMVAYFVKFVQFDSKEFIYSSFNSRMQTFSNYVVRGDIYSANGDLLATTKKDDKGEEVREYPMDKLYSHAIGYTSNGMSGVEKDASFELISSNLDVKTKLMNDVYSIKNAGDNVYTTFDTPTQQAAFDSLVSFDGAVIAMEPSTGKIVAMVSKPDFNPNNLDVNWESYTSDSSNSVLVNRATQGLYPPGSTFKIVTTLALMKQNPAYNSFNYNCSGQVNMGAIDIHCFGGKSHGNEDLMKAFAKSCNCAYASIGSSLDPEQFTKDANNLYFNNKLPVDFSGAKKSSFELTSASPRELVAQTSIGQGETLVTPLHMCMLASAIANDGNLMKPYMIDKVVSADGYVVDRTIPQSAGQIMSVDEANMLTAYMKAVINDGTGTKLKSDNYEAFGKTGTAEYSSSDQAHSWFVGFAKDYNGNELAIAVIMEKAGTGGSFAVPRAKQVFDAYFR